MTTLTAGVNLNQEQRAQVLSRYTYRNTKENEWADTTLTERFETDDEWINSRAFYITKSGRLARNPKHCLPAIHAKS